MGREGPSPPSPFIYMMRYRSELWSLCCNQSKPGRFIQHSGRRKKIYGAVGMPDMPLFKGGVIQACHKPSNTACTTACHTTGKSQLLYILNAHKAVRVPNII